MRCGCCAPSSKRSRLEAAEREGDLTIKIGICYFSTDYGIDIGELARAAEDRGFESLLLPEHTHIPVSRRTPYPAGGELPRAYAHTHDPFVALSFAAAATRKILLGTGVCLIPQRDPIVTAKCVASLDRLSNGRFIFGIGAGWNVDEMENHGARAETRFKLMRERVLAMQALWTEDEAAFHGEMVSFDPVWMYPKPQQRPHPPILLGGAGEHTLERVVEFCQGWLPIARSGFDPIKAVAALRRAASQAGRDYSTLSISAFAVPAEEAAVARCRAAGIDRAVLTVPDVSRDEILKGLDRSARLLI
ncbi:MAG TPA: LLM class F420-dependent oxidoreductase [Steroidobacteraceae bacterium]|nr:LLM class F420-dependent oxidoreductase [Steroidobacteraceae bacterium]